MEYSSQHHLSHIKLSIKNTATEKHLYIKPTLMIFNLGENVAGGGLDPHEDINGGLFS